MGTFLEVPVYINARPHAEISFPGIVVYMQVTFKVSGFYSLKPWTNQHWTKNLHTKISTAYRNMARYGTY